MRTSILHTLPNVRGTTNLAQLSHQSGEHDAYRYRFRQVTLVQTILLAAVLALCSISQAEVSLRQIGEPMFDVTAQMSAIPVGNPGGNDHFEVWGRNRQAFWSEIVDGHHLEFDVPAAQRQCNYCPIKAHDGPYDQDVQRQLIHGGILLTDSYLLNDLAYPSTIQSVIMLTPNSNAPDGPSFENPNGPILPSSIFPLKRSVRFLANGREFLSASAPSHQALDGKSLQHIDDEGNIREFDYTGLNYSHLMLGFGIHSPSRPWGFVSNEMGAVGEHEIVGTVLDVDGNGWEISNRITVVAEATDVAGDLNYNGELDEGDLNIMAQNVALIPIGHEFSEVQLRLDVNRDETVDVNDVHHWVTDLKSTFVGDANLDGEVKFDDFLALSANFGHAGGWAEGDFDANGQVEFPDFLALSANFGAAANAVCSRAR